jgi:hypothetical protein
MRPFRNAPILLIALALTWTSAAASAPTEADEAVAQVLAHANQRMAAGDSPDDVEAWLRTQMKPFEATPRPPAWDVYGAARWRALEGEPGPVLGTPAPTRR